MAMKTASSSLLLGSSLTSGLGSSLIIVEATSFSSPPGKMIP
jgi:hypothetical protein